MSAIGDAVSGLVAMWTAARPDLQVIDGPTSQSIEPQSLGVGYTEDPDATPIRVRPSSADIAMRTDRAEAEIDCVLRSWSGDTEDVAAARDAALAILADLVAALHLDPRLGGAAMLARLYGYGINEAVGGGQLAVTVNFTIYATLSANL